MTAVVIRGDAAHLPLPDNSVDLIVTSPPYFGLRSYTDGGEHYAGQIGAEPTPQEFLEALWTCTAEWMRVLKPSGSMFVNLGDSYSGKGAPGKTTVDAKNPARTARRSQRSPLDYGLDYPRKSLMLMPERYRIGCVDQLGLVARAVVVWDKPNGLPESVKDRVKRSHEDWVHLTLAPRYFSAVDEIREPHLTTGRGSDWATRRDSLVKRDGYLRNDDVIGMDNAKAAHSLGKLPGSVWTVATEPLNVPDELGVDHFAAFPTEWPRRIIQGWSPAGICTACGEGRRPVTERARVQTRKGVDAIRGENDGSIIAMSGGSGFGQRAETTATITGYACACPTPDQPTRPSVVVDPFGGTGTTALCASVLGRVGISVDLSHDYSRLAQWRTSDPGQRAKAMRVEKPPAQINGQADMLALLDGGAA